MPNAIAAMANSAHYLRALDTRDLINRMHGEQGLTALETVLLERLDDLERKLRLAPYLEEF